MGDMYYLADAPDRTRSSGRFVKENISILGLTREGTVIDLYHVGCAVFVKHIIHFVVGGCLSFSQYLSYHKLQTHCKNNQKENRQKILTKVNLEKVHSWAMGDSAAND